VLAKTRSMKLIMDYLLIILEMNLKRSLKMTSSMAKTKKTFLKTLDQRKTKELLLLLMLKKIRAKNLLNNSNRFLSKGSKESRNS
jgi:hypothetical protein